MNLTLRHNTLVNCGINSGDGSAIEIDDFLSYIAENNIIVQPQGKRFIKNDSGKTPTFRNNLFFGDASDPSYAQNSIMSDPRFVDPANTDLSKRDYRLREGSVAIDAGLARNVLADLDGITRPQGSGFDLGAYEYFDAGSIPVTPTKFRRGDYTQDGVWNITDGINMLNFLFRNTAQPKCVDAADVNDDGLFNLTDPVYLLTFLFRDGPAPKTPFALCAEDPTADSLDCQSFPQDSLTLCPATLIAPLISSAITLADCLTLQDFDRYFGTTLLTVVPQCQTLLSPSGSPTPTPSPSGY